MPSWDALRQELDRWAEAGRPATFWWRDDDAGPEVPALASLLALRGDLGAPLALAAVPDRLQDAAAARIAADPGAEVVQHGLAHANHAPAGEKKAEYGAHRPVAAMLAELSHGLKTLRARLGGRVQAVLVPPWNRIAAPLAAELGRAGYAGLSLFGPRRSAPPGLRLVNTHVDIVDWHGGRGFVGEAGALAAAVGHLAARREARADAGEATGLLTHHLVHDAACWGFVRRFVAGVAAHPAARWVGARELFGAAA